MIWDCEADCVEVCDETAYYLSDGLRYLCICSCHDEFFEKKVHIESIVKPTTDRDLEDATSDDETYLCT